MQQIEVQNLCDQFLLAYCKACSERKVWKALKAKGCLADDARIREWDQYFENHLDGDFQATLVLYAIIKSNTLFSIEKALKILRNR
jgi:hypothetical protein